MAAKSLRQAGESCGFRQAAKTYSRSSEKVEAGLEGSYGLCCTAAAIWYVATCDRCLEKCN